MQRIARSVLVIVGLVVGARHVAAQDHTLGLNLSAVGIAQVGNNGDAGGETLGIGTQSLGIIVFLK